jgi:hypothetical protein
MPPVKKILAAIVLAALPALAHAPQPRQTIPVYSTTATGIVTPYFSAAVGDFLLVSVVCDFTGAPCLAGPPVLQYPTGDIGRCYENALMHLDTATGQEQVFECRLKRGGKVSVNAPGEILFAKYWMLVQDNSSI